MSPKKKTTIIKAAALILVSAAAVSALYASYRASDILSGALSFYTGLDVRAGLVGFSPASGVTVGDIRVLNPPGYKSPYLASVKNISVLPDYSGLMHGKISIKELRIQAPELFIEKDAGGVPNAVRAAAMYKQKNKDKKPSGKKFDVGLVELAGGRVELGRYDTAVRLVNARVEGLSNIEGRTATFSFEAEETRGARLTGEGRADLFSPEPTLDARLDLAAGGLGEYVKGAASGMLEEAGLDARLDLSLHGDTARLSIGGGISGIKPWPNPPAKTLQVVYSAKAAYNKTTETLDVERALIRVPGIVDVGVSGSIKDITKGIVGDIGIESSEIKLNVVNEYLPNGVSAGGVARPGRIRLAGPLKPFGMKAEGFVRLEGASFSYGKYGTGPVNGRLELTARPEKGAMTGELKAGLELLGGTLDAGLSYSKGTGTLNATVHEVSLSEIPNMPARLDGRLDGFLKARLGGKDKGRRAEYRLTVSDASLPEKNASAAKLELKGGAKLATAGISAKGTMSAAGLAGWGRKGGALTADYVYRDGKALVGPVSYKDEVFAVSAASVSADVGKDVNEISVRGLSADYKRGLAHIEGGSLDAGVTRGPGNGLGPARCEMRFETGDAYGLDLTDARLHIAGDGKTFTGKLGLKASGNPLTLEAKAEIEAGVLKKHVLSGNLGIKNLQTLAPASGKLGLSAFPGAGALKASFALSGDGKRIDKGQGRISLSGLVVETKERTLASGVSLELAPSYEGGRLTIPPARLDFGGYFGLDLSGAAYREDGGWKGGASIGLDRTELSAVQEGIIEALPERLMWADTSGYISAGFMASYGDAGGRLTGNVELDAAGLELPDMGLYIGPAYGRIPVGLVFAKASGEGAKPAGPPPVFRGESFDRASYPALVRSYSKVPDDADIVIDSIRYGFVDLEAVTLALTPGEGWYDIDWFGLSAFKGNLYGYGRADLEGGRHALSLIVSEFSLSELCDTVPAIKGYLSGRVDGLMRVVLSGASYTGVTGAANFWAEDGPGDEREISKEFIKKLMGSSMKRYMSLFIGDRYFDTGELDIVFSKGDLVFDKLLIANTNFLGNRDLYITVAPVSNRITIEHLLQVIRDVGSRAKGM